MPLKDDFPEAYQRVGCDEELLRELAKIFVADTPELRAKLAEQIASGDYEDAARSAHALKGLVVTFDEVQAGTLIQELVHALRQGDAEEVKRLHPRQESATDHIHERCAVEVG